MRALYGTRLKTFIIGSEENNAFMDSLRNNIHSILGKNLRKTAERLEKKRIERQKAWYEKLIISHGNNYKQAFDVLVLLLVGYSCIMTVYQVAFVDKLTFT